jgi:hypothetical protein
VGYHQENNPISLLIPDHRPAYQRSKYKLAVQFDQFTGVSGPIIGPCEQPGNPDDPGGIYAGHYYGINHNSLRTSLVRLDLSSWNNSGYIQVQTKYFQEEKRKPTPRKIADSQISASDQHSSCGSIRKPISAYL